MAAIFEALPAPGPSISVASEPRGSFVLWKWRADQLQHNSKMSSPPSSFEYALHSSSHYRFMCAFVGKIIKMEQLVKTYRSEFNFAREILCSAARD